MEQSIQERLFALQDLVYRDFHSHLLPTLAKQYDAALPYMSKGKMEEWTRRKAIQKAVESCRISPEIKDYLRSLR